MAAIASLALAMFVTCSSVENDAIWPMKSESCIGFIGSWCCSWATKSLRNWSLPSSAFVARRVLGVVLVPVVPVVLW